jgi:hypothetical protein
MKAIKKTNRSPFLKVNLNILTMPEFSSLHTNRESATRIGVFIVLALHLASCPDCVASYSALRTLAFACNKKEGYLLDMIHHSGIFVYDDEKRVFQCKYICETLHVIPSWMSPAVMPSPVPIADVSAAPAATGVDESDEHVADSSSPIVADREAIADNRSTVVDNRSTIGRNTCANIIHVRTSAREDIDKDIDKNKSSPSSTSNKEKLDDDVGGSDFSLKEKIFKDNDWLRAAAQTTGLQIDTDKKLLATCARWFAIQLKAKNKTLKSVADGQSYFVYLMQTGHRTRENFDSFPVAAGTRRRRDAHHGRAPQHVGV